MIHSPHCGRSIPLFQKITVTVTWRQAASQGILASRMWWAWKKWTAHSPRQRKWWVCCNIIQERCPQHDTQILRYGETDKRNKNFRRATNLTPNKSHKKPACQSDILLVPYQQALKEFSPQATESASTLWIIALFAWLHYLFIHSCIIYTFSFIIWPCEE